jgi:hypothetical protein
LEDYMNDIVTVELTHTYTLLAKRPSLASCNSSLSSEPCRYCEMRTMCNKTSHCCCCDAPLRRCLSSSHAMMPHMGYANNYHAIELTGSGSRSIRSNTRIVVAVVVIVTLQRRCPPSARCVLQKRSTAWQRCIDLRWSVLWSPVLFPANAQRRVQ